MQFQTKHKPITDIQVAVKDRVLLNTTSLKSLGLKLDNKLTWKPYGIKLNKSCYAIRAIKPFVYLKSLISVYSSYFHSLMMYGIILGVIPQLVGKFLKSKKDQSELSPINLDVIHVNIFLNNCKF
jgi:hypothetical protein